MALAHQICTPLSISAKADSVMMVFNAPKPDGTAAPNASVTVSAFDDGGFPKSPAQISSDLISAARAWYVQQYGYIAVAPALPAAFQIN